jgi:hypothetical protein
MHTLASESTARAVQVSVSDTELEVVLADGRRVAVPLVWYPRLFRATPEQRGNWELLGDGIGIHWPDVDEDLSVAGLLRGAPAPGYRAEEVAEP